MDALPNAAVAVEREKYFSGRFCDFHMLPLFLKGK
jgi:hypothetical protein